MVEQTEKPVERTQEEIAAEEALAEKTRQQWDESQKEQGIGGVFDRQARIQNWDQSKIESQNCLLLGVGGLGSGVAMGLARLGVRKLILIDNGTVEESNLNR